MKWVLVIFAFQLSADDDVENAEVSIEVYDSQEECDQMGETYRARVSLPDESKSLSSCIPQSIFDEPQESATET
ncbi:MAG: hypothetical protein WBM39_11035 [Parasphingorhabdus sp.]